MVIESYEEDGITPAYVFDGFCHRPYNPKTDGWVLTQLHVHEFPVVQIARNVLDLYDECNRLNRLAWELEQRVRRQREHLG